MMAFGREIADALGQWLGKMRIPINLSTEPFRKDRPVLMASAAVAVALGLLLCGLIYLILADRARVKDTRVAVARLDNEVRRISSEQAKLEGTLRLPANAEVLQRSYLLNTLIEHKAISWTKIFSDLESVMPLDVRIISVRLPQITSQGEVVLDVEVGAKEVAPIGLFLNRLVKSPLFGPVEGKSTQPPTQQEPIYKYRFTVNYAQKL
jgi:type IV pilus assembly protein PilN